MPKVWFPIRAKLSENGFSPVEILLAATVFGFLVTALIGAVIYGRESTAGSGDRARAIFLADEGLQAVRNMRDSSYALLATDGTYYLSQTGSQWGLSAAWDAN